MFEQETDLIMKTIRQRMPNYSRIALKDILAADIPSPLKTFFRADVELLLLEEQRKYRKTSRFSFDHPEVQSLQNQINSFVIMHYSFELEELHRRMEDAVHLLVNYLVRPQWTLIGTLFEREETISSASLKDLLRYFGPYEYLKDLIARYLQQKNQQSVQRRELSAILWKLDGEFIRRKAGDELARLLSPLFDFFDYPRNSASSTLPIKALIKHFEDKGLTTVIHRLEGEVAQGSERIARSGLGTLLEDVRRTFGAFVTEPKEERALPPEEAGSPKDPAAGGGEASRTQGDRRIEFPEDERKRIVKRIFGHRQEEFEASLNALSSLTTWKQASVFIDEIFIKNDIDPYSADARKFVDLISQRYLPKR